MQRKARYVRAPAARRRFALNASALEQRTFEAGFPSMAAGFDASFDQLDEYLKTAA